MAAKYRNGVLRKPGGGPFPLEQSADGWNVAMAAYVNHADAFGVNTALDAASGCAVLCNQFIEVQKPWALAKEPAEAERLDAVLYHLADSLRNLAILVSPVLPKAAHGIFDQLNWKTELSGNDSRFSSADVQSGGLPDGHQLGKPTPLFPRIETPAA
jgi:methionyl-tRNA synthetase